MLDYLKDVNISDTTIEKIKKENNEGSIYDLYCNKIVVIDIINYLREIGINCIDELLIYQVDIFYLSLDELKEMINKRDISEFVRKVNEDFLNISVLFEE